MPSFNHTRADGPYAPCPRCARDLLESALRKMGVEFAGRDGDKLRWSVSDLATDLAPLLVWLDDHEDVPTPFIVEKP